MTEPPPRLHRPWSRKFADAFRGVAVGVWGQRSFTAHFTIAAAVIACGFAFGVTLTEWCFLLLCITAVLVTELLNSAVEFLAKAVTDTHHPMVRDALDICSGAVLVAAVGSALVGAIIFLNRLGLAAGWW
jgi:diacylglycerol kinase